MRRRVSQRNDNVRPNASNLLAQKRRAGKHLFRTRVAISRRTAFEHVGDIDLLARQACQRQDAVEVLARSAHKGFSLQVFIATRRLAHKHHARMGVARTKDNLGPRLTQLAQATVAEHRPNLVKRHLAWLLMRMPRNLHDTHGNPYT